MSSKLKLFALVPALSVVLMGASECNVGGKPSNPDDPKQGTEQCLVTNRANNSNGTAYLEIDCNGAGDGFGPGGGVRSLMTDTEWPMCRVGATWPGCKEG